MDNQRNRIAFALWQLRNQATRPGFRLPTSELDATEHRAIREWQKRQTGLATITCENGCAVGPFGAARSGERARVGARLVAWQGIRPARRKCTVCSLAEALEEYAARRLNAPRPRHE